MPEGVAFEVNADDKHPYGAKNDYISHSEARMTVRHQPRRLEEQTLPPTCRYLLSCTKTEHLATPLRSERP